MNVTIVSAHFNPGHMAHLKGLYSLFSDCGDEVNLLLDVSYLDHFDCSQYRIIAWDINTVFPIADIVIIYAMSVHDVRIIKKFKQKNKQCKVLTVVHEPWCGFKYWKRYLAEGSVTWKNVLRYLAVHEYSKRILKRSSAVLLPSHRAMDMYGKYESRLNKNMYLFPLVYADEAKHLPPASSRKYFSFAANASDVKGFPLFIEFIKKYLQSDKDLYVKIITRGDISTYLDGTLQASIDDGHLCVLDGKIHSDAEMNNALMESKCAWLLYSRSTQSSVMVRAFMCGCPVLASDLDCFRECINGSNGIICKSKSLEDIYLAYQTINASVEDMSAAARKSFFDYSCKNHIDDMRNIIHDVCLHGERT